MAEKIRLDVYMTENGMTESRERAKALIMAGQVYIDNQKCDTERKSGNGKHAEERKPGFCRPEHRSQRADRAGDPFTNRKKDFKNRRKNVTARRCRRGANYEIRKEKSIHHNKTSVTNYLYKIMIFREFQRPGNNRDCHGRSCRSRRR